MVRTSHHEFFSTSREGRQTPPGRREAEGHPDIAAPFPGLPGWGRGPSPVVLMGWGGAFVLEVSGTYFCLCFPKSQVQPQRQTAMLWSVKAANNLPKSIELNLLCLPFVLLGLIHWFLLYIFLRLELLFFCGVCVCLTPRTSFKQLALVSSSKAHGEFVGPRNEPGGP